MKNFVLFMLCMLLIPFASMSQYVYYEYGKLEPEEMTMKVCPIDQEAGAVVICDVGKLWFVRDVDKFKVVFERFMRFKILHEDGLENSRFTIPLYYEGAIKEKLSSLEGHTWNLSDKIWKSVELPKKFYQQEVINDNYSLITVEMPAVEVGSIVEYKYTITSPFFMPVHGWEFQNRIPTLLSFLEVRMIPFYEYTFLQVGKKPDIQKSFRDKEEHSIGKNQGMQYGNIKYNEMVYHFGMNNMQATEENPARIDFQLSKIIDLNGVGLKVTDSWDKTIKELLSDDKFGDFIDKSEAKADKLIELDYYASKEPFDRFYSIVRQVKERYRWNGIIGKYAPISVNEFLKEGQGNSGALNLFTIGLLKAAGIDAYPVILSSKAINTVNTDYPFLHLYDYVLIAANIEGNLVLADATDPLLADNLIPLRCLNSKGLIVKKNSEEWVNCYTNDLSSTRTSLVINVPLANELTRAEMTKNATGYDSYLLKSQFKDNKEQIAKYYTDKGYILRIEDITTQDFGKAYEPYTVTAQLLVPIPSDGQTIQIDPFMNEAINVNPLKEEMRDYPTDFYYEVDKSYSSEIIVPTGFSVVKLPENFEMSNSLIEMKYTVTNEPGVIRINAHYKLPKATYQPLDYTKIRSYFQEIVKRFNEPVILQKGE